MTDILQALRDNLAGVARPERETEIVRALIDCVLAADAEGLAGAYTEKRRELQRLFDYPARLYVVRETGPVITGEGGSLWQFYSVDDNALEPTPAAYDHPVSDDEPPPLPGSSAYDFEGWTCWLEPSGVRCVQPPAGQEPSRPPMAVLYWLRCYKVTEEAT